MTPGHERLRKLSDEAYELAAAPTLNIDGVKGWRERASAAVAEICGHDSDAARDLSKIKFSDEGIVGVAERVLRDKAAEHGIDLSNDRIPLPSPEKAIRRGLHEASDFIRSLTI